MENELSIEILDALACPACNAELKYKKENSRLICSKCKKEFRIENGIPNMLVKE